MDPKYGNTLNSFQFKHCKLFLKISYKPVHNVKSGYKAYLNETLNPIMLIFESYFLQPFDEQTRCENFGIEKL